MLAVLSGTLLVGRLGVEVGQSRWYQLSQEEQASLFSWSKWLSGLMELRATILKSAEMILEKSKSLFPKSQSKAREKKWVRKESVVSKEKLLEDRSLTSAKPKVDNLKGQFMSLDSSSEFEEHTNQGS